MLLCVVYLSGGIALGSSGVDSRERSHSWRVVTPSQRLSRQQRDASLDSTTATSPLPPSHWLVRSPNSISAVTGVMPIHCVVYLSGAIASPPNTARLRENRWWAIFPQLVLLLLLQDIERLRDLALSHGIDIQVSRCKIWVNLFVYQETEQLIETRPDKSLQAFCLTKHLDEEMTPISKQQTI